MRFYALFALAILALACGDQEDYDDAGIDDGAELGTAEQAFAVSVTMGLEDNTLNRCVTPWTTCDVPSTKTLKYSEQCTGCDADMTASIGSGGAKWAVTLGNTGWSTTLVNPGTQGEYITINNGVIAGSNDIRLVQSVSQQGQIQGPPGDGKYRKINHCTATVDLKKTSDFLVAHPPDVLGGCGAGTTCRKKAFENQVQAAFYYCTGIGFQSADRNSVTSGPHWAVISQGINNTEVNSLINYKP